MSDIKNEVMHGQIGSPFNACPYDVTSQSGDGVKGGTSSSPFSQWKQPGGDLPITVETNIAYSGTGQLETPMDEPSAGAWAEWFQRHREERPGWNFQSLRRALESERVIPQEIRCESCSG